jgi:GAF domain-containing protein
MATSMPRPAESQLSKNIKIERGSAPGAGFADSHDLQPQKDQVDVILSMESALRELRGLLAIADQFNGALDVEETLALLATRLKRVVRFDAIVIFSKQNRILTPKYVSGEDAEILAKLEIPLDQGLSGWVAENRKPIANGNPAVEPGYFSGRLCSALSVPLESNDRLNGVLSLYRTPANAFRAEDLQTMLAVSNVFAVAVSSREKKPEFAGYPAFALPQSQQAVMLN